MSEAVSTLDGEVAPAVQPGRELTTAREGCGLSVADIARQLKLSPWQVEALEAGDYRRLPGAVFVRGFIRNYARLVKLDSAPLLASAEPRLPQTTHAVPEMPRSVATFPTGHELRWHKYAIAAIVLVIPIVLFEFYRDDTHEVTVKSRQVALPTPRVVMEAKPVEAAPSVPPVAAVSDAPAKPLRAEPPRVRPEQAQSDKLPVAEQTASVERKPGEHLVRLRFEQESWVEIRDRNGRKIFSQLNPAGTVQSVSGLPPLSLVVGNAAGVRLLLNNRPVDLAPHIKVDVARLTLE
jgi:cytoskeleton protein RodZ